MTVTLRARTVALVCATVLLGGCATADGAPFDSYVVPSATRILVSVRGCDGSARLAELNETADSIEVRIYSDPPGGDDCAQDVTVDLTQPLGDRTVIDLSRGVEVPPPSS